jgi:hypothetical protein
MPATHDSVIYCQRCDWYVATIETSACKRCGRPVCPGCAKPTSDKDLTVCSDRCQAIFNRRIQGAAA